MEIKTIDKYYYQSVAKELNKVRIDRKLSYRQLSKITGLSATSIDNYFLGKAKIKEPTFKLLCDALGIFPVLTVAVKLG